MPHAASSSPRHQSRLVKFHAQHGITDGRRPQADLQPGHPAGVSVSPGRYVVLERDSHSGSTARPATQRLMLVPRATRPEPSHPAVRLLGLVLALACLALLWQFGKLLERDGVFDATANAMREVTR